MNTVNQGKTWLLVFRFREGNDLQTETAIAQNCSRADAVKIGKRQAEERGGNSGKYWFMGADAVTTASLN